MWRTFFYWGSMMWRTYRDCITKSNDFNILPNVSHYLEWQPFVIGQLNVTRNPNGSAIFQLDSRPEYDFPPVLFWGYQNPFNDVTENRLQSQSEFVLLVFGFGVQEGDCGLGILQRGVETY